MTEGTTSPTPGAWPDRRWVLVAEDHPDTIEFLYLRLTEAGYLVQVATRGDVVDAALEAKRLPDLVLMDINLPEIDGDRIVEKMRSNERTRDIPVVFVTADDPERVAHLVDGRTTLCLEKPLSTRVLLATMLKVLSARSQDLL